MAKKEVLVAGAGPAGMMAAGTAARSGAHVTVLDRNKRPGRKLLITGKGRCNVTNNCDTRDFIASVPTNGRFLYSAISTFSPQDTMAFFEGRGVALKTERGNRVFPQSDKAADIVDAMRSFLLDSGCRYINGRVTNLILENGRVKGVKLDDGRSLSADCVIVACGGKSYPLTGSSGDGYALGRRGIRLQSRYRRSYRLYLRTPFAKTFRGFPCVIYPSRFTTGRKRKKYIPISASCSLHISD